MESNINLNIIFELLTQEQQDELILDGLACCGAYCSEAGCCPFTTKNKKMITKNKDYKYDLKLGEQVENELANILGDNSLIEVKYDQFDNDRHFIEYKRIGIDGNEEYTGIATTHSDYYCLSKSGYYMLIKTQHLKEFIKETKPNIVLGGDDKRTYGFLITETNLFNYLRSKIIFDTIK